MDERRKAELLTIHLRWLVLLTGAYVIDASAVRTLTAVLVVATVFVHNAIALYIAANKSLFARYGPIAAPASRCLDLIAITLAAHWGGAGAKDLYLLYPFVIVSTGYAYNRLLPTAMALTASLALDSASAHIRSAGAANVAGTFTQHTSAFLLAALTALYIIAFKKQDETMRIKEHKLSALFECGTRFTSSQNLSQLLNYVLDTAIAETGAAGGSIMLLDTHGKLVPEIVRSSNDPEGPPDNEIARLTLSAGEPMVLNDRSDKEEPDTQDTAQIPVACVPLTDRNTEEYASEHNMPSSRVIGTLSVYGTRHGPGFEHEDVDLLRTLALYASMGVNNSKLYHELHTTFLRTLQSLARSLEAKDPYTQGHSCRVSEISQIVAQHLDLPPEAVDILRNAALLHDIGKVGIPDSVLQKPGQLNPEERLVIQTHPVTSENICRPLGLPADALFLIRHHQERLNGSGYPDQLPADQHPLTLRILSAVDVLDAMSSDRPYRKALTVPERLEQLNRASGTEFDPVVVEILKSMLQSGELDRFYTKTQDDSEAA